MMTVAMMHIENLILINISGDHLNKDGLNTLPTLAQAYKLNFMMTLCAFFTFVLASCASLPTLTEAQQTATAAPLQSNKPEIQLQGAKTTMSPKQSRVVLDKLELNAPDTGIFDRHLAFENAVTSEPLTVGNRVQLLQDGAATYQAMSQAILAAKDHINLETYIIENDEVGRAFVKLLIDKQRAGVHVNLIYDSVGSINTPRTFFDELREAGASVLEFNPVNPLNAKKGWDINQRDHRKLLIADGKTVFLGGVNISSVYSSGSFGRHKVAKQAAKNGEKQTPWRDTHIEISGPVVASFQRLFLSTWDKQKGTPLKDKKYFPVLKVEGKEVIRAIASSSDDVQKGVNAKNEITTPIYTTFLSAIMHAETSIFITNAYFVPDMQLIDALKAAVTRGVKVKILLPGYTDSALVFHAGRFYYNVMLEGGIEIYERSDRLLHSKTVLIDGVWSSVGSSNLDWRSFLHNDEVVAIVLGTEFGNQMLKMFEKDLAASQQVTLEKWEDRPYLNRVKERAARVWAYWL